MAALPADHPLRRLYPRSEMLLIGWGEQSFYYSDGTDLWLALDALMPPSPSVMHVGDDAETDARYLGRAVADCNLSWFEEPLHQNDAVLLADLRHHINMPIAAGQMEGSRWRFRELMMHKSVDIVQPNCIYCGGFTEQRKIGHMAQAFNMPVANGAGWPTLNVHTMAGLMNGTVVELHLGTTHMEKTAFKDAPMPEGNRLKVPTKPGLGFEPDWDALKDVRVKE